MTFTFLPLLGLSHAMQAITGNNYGAAQWQRSNNSLVFAGVAAFCYCTILQILMTVYAADIGQIFVDDPVVVAEVARILPVIVKVYFFSGPLMMVAAYFQAIGHAGHATILSLARPFLLAIPLTFILSATLGEIGIWIAGPAAGLMMLALTIAVDIHRVSRVAALGAISQNLRGKVLS